jgi:predicted nucleic acid-binding protein
MIAKSSNRMNNGLVIADSGPIFSLVLIDKLDILDALFDDIKIPQAVWEEITFDKTKSDYQKLYNFFKDKTCQILGLNELTFVMDYGESESLILYKELNADFLLIDDKKARKIAENFEINCIGIIGLLSIAKDKGLIGKLKPVFETFLQNKRFYSIDLLNTVLVSKGEEKINYKA